MCPSVVAGRGARGGGEREGVTRGLVGAEKARGLGDSGQQGVRFRREGNREQTDRSEAVAVRQRQLEGGIVHMMQTKGDSFLWGKEHVMDTAITTRTMHEGIVTI